MHSSLLRTTCVFVFLYKNYLLRLFLFFHIYTDHELDKSYKEIDSTTRIFYENLRARRTDIFLQKLQSKSTRM